MKFLIILIFTNIIIFFKFKSIAKYFNIYDVPDNSLKKHKQKVPILGGIIFYINFIIFYIMDTFIIDKSFLDFSKRENLSLFIMVSSFFILGLYDDKFKISAIKRIIIAIFICLFVATLNKELSINVLKISFYKNLIVLDNFKLFFTILCIVVFVHSTNMLDGINLQLLLYFIILTIYLAIISNNNSQIYILVLLVLSFLLILNFQNKIFLGDSGSYAIASFLSFFIINEYNIYNSINYADEIVLMMFLPGIELLRLSLQRLYSGKGIFDGDLNHIHHILIKKNSLLITNIKTLTFSAIPILIIFIFKQYYLQTFLALLGTYLFIVFYNK